LSIVWLVSDYKDFAEILANILKEKMLQDLNQDVYENFEVKELQYKS